MAQTPEQKAAAKAARDAKRAAAAASASDAVSEAPAKGDPITVKFRDHKGEPTERTFSKDVHGEDFAKIADEFKATNASRIIA